MKSFYWDSEKNDELQKSRGLSFEQVLYALETNRLLDVLIHPNQTKYKEQVLLIVDIENYAVAVPMQETRQGYFLRTAYLSRKMTKKYLGGQE